MPPSDSGQQVPHAESDPDDLSGQSPVADPSRRSAPSTGSPEQATPPGPRARSGSARRIRQVPDPWTEWLRRAEQLAATSAEGVRLPAWRRKTPGEPRWPVTLCVIAAIVLQLLLPTYLTRPVPDYLLPALEGALLVGLSIGLAVTFVIAIPAVWLTFHVAAQLGRMERSRGAALLGVNLPSPHPPLAPGNWWNRPQ